MGGRWRTSARRRSRPHRSGPEQVRGEERPGAPRGGAARRRNGAGGRRALPVPRPHPGRDRGNKGRAAPCPQSAGGGASRGGAAGRQNGAGGRKAYPVLHPHPGRDRNKGRSAPQQQSRRVGRPSQGGRSSSVGGASGLRSFPGPHPHMGGAGDKRPLGAAHPERSEDQHRRRQRPEGLPWSVPSSGRIGGDERGRSVPPRRQRLPVGEVGRQHPRRPAA